MKNRDLFEKNPLFASLQEEEFDQLIAACARKVFSKNTIILSEGDQTDSLYIIYKGKVKVSIIDEQGKEIILSILGPGEYFGEMTALVDGKSRSASVTTRESCTVYIITKRDFRNLVSHNPDIVFNLLRGSMERLREANKKIESLALMDVYGRVARLFTSLAKQNSDQTSIIEEKLTHQDIANMVGSSREMISRVMKELSNGGYISVDKKIIVINGKLPYAW